MIIIITIIIVHAEQHFHNHVDNAHLPLIYSNRKCHDRQFFGQAVGSRHLFLWIFMSWIWRKYGICFGQHPWHFFKHLTGWNGISIPTRTDTSNFQGGQRAKASMRGFSVMLGEQEKLPPSAAKWPSMPRMIDTGRCKKGDSSVRTTWSRASIFRSTTISRCLWPSSHKKRGSIHRHDSPCSLSALSIYLRKMTWRHQKLEESIAMFDFQVFIQLFLHMHWGTWLKFPKFINQHFLLPLVSNHPKGCSPLACHCWGYPILPNGAVWYSNGIICYPTLVAACWCQHQMATGYTNLLIPCRPPCLSINTSRCHHGICWLTPFNLCVCAMISSTMWNTRCIFHACYAFYACCCCCFVFCFF